MRLLVGYLATKGGADAVAVATMIARTIDASLDLAMIVPEDEIADALAPSGGYHEHVRHQAQQWLDEAAKVVTDVPVTTHVVSHESFAEGLIELAEKLEVSAIVVGGDGGGIIGSLSLGAVVNELLHASPVPVVLSPRGARHVPATRVREVTCAIGSRPGAAEVFRTAIESTARAGVPLRLVSLVALDDRGSAAVEHAQRYVEQARASLPADVDVTSVVAEGATVEDAVNQLDWHDGDVILVGSSRLAQPRRLFLGSTAARMLRVLRVPVIVVPRGHDK
jgi:nucleotide-binding universal stress UspA family protein